MSYFLKMVAECVEKQGNPLITQALYPPEIDIGSKNIASNFNQPVPPNWVHWVDPKTGISYFVDKDEWNRKDPCIHMDQYYYPKKFLEGTSISASASAFASTSGTKDVKNPTAKPANFLLMVNCKACKTHMLVVQDAKACPRCGGSLLHFEEERCSN